MIVNYKNVCLVFLFLTLAIKGQSKESKWIVAGSVAWVNYNEEDAQVVRGSFINQTPRFSIARYLLKGVSLEGSFSTSIGADNQEYTTIDGGVRYDFGLSRNNVVPYVVVGGSIIDALGVSSTLNGGVGSTFWFADNFGLKAQFLYKFVTGGSNKQRAHTMPSLGLVYSFKKRSLYPTLWDLDN